MLASIQQQYFDVISSLNWMSETSVFLVVGLFVREWMLVGMFGVLLCRLVVVVVVVVVVAAAVVKAGLTYRLVWAAAQGPQD